MENLQRLLNPEGTCTVRQKSFQPQHKNKISKSLSCITFSMTVSVTDSKEQITQIIHTDVRKTQPLPAFLKKSLSAS